MLCMCGRVVKQLSLSTLRSCAFFWFVFLSNTTTKEMKQSLTIFCTFSMCLDSISLFHFVLFFFTWYVLKSFFALFECLRFNLIIFGYLVRPGYFVKMFSNFSLLQPVNAYYKTLPDQAQIPMQIDTE